MIIYICEVLFLGKTKTLIDDNLNAILDRVKSLMRRDIYACIISLVEVEKTSYSYHYQSLKTIEEYVNNLFSLNPLF